MQEPETAPKTAFSPERFYLAPGLTLIDDILQARRQTGVETLEGFIGPLLRTSEMRVHSSICQQTATALRRLIRADGSDEPLFKNVTGRPLSRDGVAYVIRKHASTAAQRCPALRKRHITPHVLRHSCACALLQAGIDITVIRDYLGHSSVATTSRYVSTNLRMKRDALEAFWKRAGLDAKGARKWQPSPKLLAFLETL
jgi:integrase